MKKPAYGVGFQLGSTTIPLLSELCADGAPFDFAELLCDPLAGSLDSPYFVEPSARPIFDELKDKYPLVAHSNHGAAYGPDPLEDTAVLRRHLGIAHEMESPWFADHMFYGTRTTAYAWSTPLQFSKRELERVASRAAALQDKLKMPLCHENGYFYNLMPGSEIAEAEFMSRLVERAQTHLLLDLHNIYSNSFHMKGYDCWQYLKSIPLDKIIEIHIAGGQWIENWYHDLHNNPVPEPVWEMLQYVLQNAKNVRGVVLEVQGPVHNINSRRVDSSWIGMIRTDLARAKAIWETTHAGGVAS